MNLKPVSKTRKPKVERDPLEASLNAVPGLKKPKVTSSFEESDEFEPIRKRGLDPLTEQLGCTAYYHKMIWPAWFVENVRGVNYRLSVSRYYHEKKVAIDMRLNASDITKMGLKANLLQAHGIQYFHLTDEESITEMLTQIGEQ